MPVCAAMAAATPIACPMLQPVPITRVELMAACVQLASRPANIRLAMLRE